LWLLNYRALRASVLSSIAIEGVKKAAERALNKCIFDFSSVVPVFRQSDRAGLLLHLAWTILFR